MTYFFGGFTGNVTDSSDIHSRDDDESGVSRAITRSVEGYSVPLQVNNVHKVSLIDRQWFFLLLADLPLCRLDVVRMLSDGRLERRSLLMYS